MGASSFVIELGCAKLVAFGARIFIFQYHEEKF
jgi:hypothetical protein